MKNILFTDVSVKRQITDSISENLTGSDLESDSPENVKGKRRGKKKLFIHTNITINFEFLLTLGPEANYQHQYISSIIKQG